MSSTIDTNALQNLGVSTVAPKPNDEVALLQEDFLKLMTAQMENQDPFEPMDSGEFMTQIAQFSASSGIQGLQQSVDSMAASLTSNQVLQATSLVGRSVTIETGAANLTSDGDISGVVGVPYSTTNLKVDVLGPGGQLLRTIDLGASNAGIVPFKWDGMLEDGTRAAAGSYSVRASATIDGETVALGTYMDAHVDSVSMGRAGQSPILNLAGYGSVEFNQVSQVK